jgi:ABC-type transport system involved in cytochrome bd biosynthesis fused ATPase/permease subunit
MPLSEDEQRILRQIEEQLQRDPGFARDLRPAVSSSRRSLLLGVVAGVVAVAVCILLLSVSPYLAFAAFVAAMAAVVYAERHARALGDEAIRQVAAMRRNAGARTRDN